MEQSSELPLDPGREQQLIRASRRDPDAFRELYTAYFPRVYGYVAYRVGRTQDAEDLVAETFLRVVEQLDSFEYRSDGSFAAWILRIAHNLVCDHYRAQDREAQRVSRQSGEAALPRGAPDVMHVVLQRESFEQLRSLISRLSARRQEVIVLRFFAGLRNHEIARVLDVDERTVASHLCRGLKDLHELYQRTVEAEAHYAAE